MGYTVAQKIIASHAVESEIKTGAPVSLRIDQTLTQDATGTMAYLEFEAMGIPRVKTELSAAYIDHNTLQSGFENADDHKFIRSAAAKYGVRYSRPGNGICHQVHLERFAVPGKTLLGSDSHTPTCGGMGMLAIGAGGMDVAVAMGGGTYTITMPKIVKAELKNSLRPMVSAKDIILEILRILTVKGGVGKIIEYCGDGIKDLSVPQRATIANMGAELGCTTSVFPSDSVTLEFLKAQGREADFTEITADEDAVYDEEFTVDLAQLSPAAACPHMPDRVKKVSEIGKIKIDQVIIGSCTNSSYTDLMTAAWILKGKKVHPGVSLAVAPGSRQVLAMLAGNGALADMISAGARILETACGPCIGMGQAPCSDGVSLRTFNRNFEGRSGTKNAQVYLVSPETAACSALAGVLTDPTECAPAPRIGLPEKFLIDDSMIELPADPETARGLRTARGANIKPLPVPGRPQNTVRAEIVLKTGDDITTDHIMPAGAKILPFRSNIPKMSEFCFSGVDAGFPERARKAGSGIIIGGKNYGQGSSREHAALVPMYLGIKAVIAKSFARMHRDNLINCGILPLVFDDPDDYGAFALGDRVVLENVPDAVAGNEIYAECAGSGRRIKLLTGFSEKERKILLAGGLLNYISDNGGKI